MTVHTAALAADMSPPASAGAAVRTGSLIDMESAVVRFPAHYQERASLKTMLASPFQRGGKDAVIEALRGIDLRVGRGERVGLIGRNGAGKSTLLRALAGVYPLAEGRLSVVRNVRGLFDLGVGFDIEESGRRNIYYRGYLLGMTRREIEAVENEIIAFSELGEAIDRPLKTYSAGMQVRLAFAISTATSGDVLLIDEVLAAGDAAFAVKAQQRVRELVDAAACLVLVTHDMSAVRELCNRALWIDGGRVRAEGAPDDIIAAYEDAAT